MFTLDMLPWAMVACVMARLAFSTVQGSRMQAQLAMTRDRLGDALARIDQLGVSDRLTGLPNRTALLERLAELLPAAERDGMGVGVFFIDLDRFRRINATLGHGVGDEVLHEAARRLSQAARSDDVVARLEGDEFVVLAPGVRRREELDALADTLLQAFHAAFAAEGQEIALTASIGIALGPRDGPGADALLANAAAAAQRAKDQGRNRCSAYAAGRDGFSSDRLQLEAALRYAVAREEFEVHYQPKVSFTSGRVTGCEALLRWRHPQLGLLAPDRFVPIAEDNGLIVPIGYWVLRRVCQRIRRWTDEGNPLPVAVNLCASQFHEPHLVDEIAAILRDTGVAPGMLELEITETMVMQDPERALGVMTALRAMGVGLSLDDFGTGHSSLGYLKRFPIDQLKIDRSFVRDVPGNEGDVVIARAIIAMAHSLGISVVAEGVEETRQFESLRGEGCDEFQGLLCCGPVPEGEVMRFLFADRAQQALVAMRAAATSGEAAMQATAVVA